MARDPQTLVPSPQDTERLQKLADALEILLREHANDNSLSVAVDSEDTKIWGIQIDDTPISVSVNITQ